MEIMDTRALLIDAQTKRDTPKRNGPSCGSSTVYAVRDTLLLAFNFYFAVKRLPGSMSYEYQNSC